MKIATKIKINSVTAISCLAAVVSFTVYRYSSERALLNEINTTKQLVYTIAEMRGVVVSSNLVSEYTLINNLDNSISEFRKALNSYSEPVVRSDSVYKDSLRSEERIVKIAGEIRTIMDSKDKNQEYFVYLQNQFLAESNDVLKNIRILDHKLIEYIDSYHYVTIITVLFLVGVSCGVVLWLSGRTWLNVDRALKKLIVYAGDIHTGKKDTQIVIDHSDEFVVAYEAFNTLSNEISRSHRELNNELVKVKELTRTIKIREETLSKVIETIPVGLCIFAVNGNMTFANKSAEEIIGYSRETLLKYRYDDPMWQINDIDGDPLPSDEHPFAMVIRGHRAIENRELSLVTNQDIRKTISMNAAPLYGDDDVLSGVLIVFSDISSRFVMEKDLLEATVYMENLFQNTNSPIVVWDSDIIIRKVNRAFQRLVGRRERDLVGTKADIIFPESEKENALDKMRATALGTRWESVELTILRRDGDVRLVEWNTANLTDSFGKYHSTLGQGQDITDKRRAEELISMSERRFRLLFNEMQLGAALHEILCDSAGMPVDYRFLEVNPAFEKMIGISSSNIVGRRVKDIYGNNVDLFMIEEYGRVALSGIPVRFENYSSGAGRYYEVVAYSPEKGKFAAIFSDVTERKNAEKVLSGMKTKLEKMVSERTAELAAYANELESFTYSVSHDLRAPLRSIEGFSRALEEDCSNLLDDHGKDYLARINSAAGRMGKIIEDLLRLSRITRAECGRDNFSLSDLVNMVYRDISSRTGVKTEFVFEKDIFVQGDKSLIQIALTNLIDNALKFSTKAEFPRIEFGSELVNGEKIFFIQDNGAGFDMRYVAELFRPFQRLHKESEFTGTGLGLAIVQRVIHRHGGRIWGEGMSGKGARFMFTLG